MNPLIQQQHLMEMFRQAFSPLNTLGSGQLALAQAQYQQQQEQMQRQQQLEGQRSLMIENDRLLGARQLSSQQAARELEALRSQNHLTTSMAAAGLGAKENRRSQELARLAAERKAARDSAALHGIDDLDPTDPDYVNKVTTRVAETVKKHRGSATKIFTDLNSLTAQIEQLSQTVDVPQARQVQLAKPLLIAGATDPDKIAEYRKLNSIDDIMAAAAEDGSSDRILAALNAEQRLRNDTFEKKARPLLARQTQYQRTLQSLEMRGISPDYDSLNVMEDAGRTGGTGGGDIDTGGDDLGLDQAPPPPLAPEAAPDGRAPAYSLKGLWQRREPIAQALGDLPLRNAALPGQAIDWALRHGNLLWDGTVAKRGPIQAAGEGIGDLLTSPAAQQQILSDFARSIRMQEQNLPAW